MIAICNPLLAPCYLKPTTFNPLKQCGLKLAKLAKDISDINNILHSITWVPANQYIQRAANRGKFVLQKNKILKEPWYSFNGESIKLLPLSNGFYTGILQRCYEQLRAMMSYHSKVLVIRYDFHLYDHTECNTIMSKFIRKLKRRLKPPYNFKRIGYIWAREWNESRGQAKAQHYHCAIMLNGNRVRHPEKINTIVKDIWERLGQAHVYLPKHQYYLIKPTDRETLAAARKRLSYLAKVYTKGNKERYTNNYSTSRLIPKS